MQFEGKPVRVMAFRVPLEPNVSVELGEVRVSSFMTWRDLLKLVDRHDLSIGVVPADLGLTVGEAVDANLHGRNPSAGPIVRITRGASVILPSGEASILANRDRGREEFYIEPGLFSSVVALADVVLGLTPNARVERSTQVMQADKYPEFFFANVMADPTGIPPRESGVEWLPRVALHDAVLYAPGYDVVRAVSWSPTEKPLTEDARLFPSTWKPQRRSWWIEILGWCVVHLPGGSYFRRYVADPLFYLGNPVVRHNYALSCGEGYVMDLERVTHPGYVTQEYYVPTNAFEPFRGKLASILSKRHVPTVNVSIQYSPVDRESKMPWAKSEVFIFRVTYKRTFRGNDDPTPWARELIDAATDLGGSFDLASQAKLATAEQILRAYPNTVDFLAEKFRYDDAYRFHNALIDKLCPDEFYEAGKQFWASETGHYNRLWEDYGTLRARAKAIDLYQLAGIQSRADITERRRLVKLLIAANGDLLEEARAQADEHLMLSKLKAPQLPDYLAHAFVRSLPLQEEPYAAYFINMREIDRRFADALEGMLAIAEREWGHWQMDPSGRGPLFESRDAAAAYIHIESIIAKAKQEEDLATQILDSRNP